MKDIAEALHPHLHKVSDTFREHLSSLLQDLTTLDNSVEELNIAFVQCDAKTIEKYLNLGFDPNLPLPGDHFPLTHLMTFAISGKWVEIAELLIKRGASPNVRDSKGVPVMFSLVSSGQVDLVSLAISYGADLDFRGGDGENAVLVAVHYKQIDSLKLLLKNGCDPNVVDRDGNSAVMWAAGRSNGIGMQRSLTCLKLLLDHGALVNVSNEKKFTPLMAATLIREVDAVKELISAGADLEARDKKGNTALMKAIDGDAEELVRLFLRSGANVNASNNKGMTPLMTASSLTILEDLILAGADINATDSLQRSVLHFQTDADQWENVRVLLEFGANHFAKNKRGEIPLQIAIRRKNSKTIFLLIDAGSPIHESNNNGVGLIHDALLPWDYFSTIDIFPKLNTPALWRELLFYTSQYRSLTHKLMDILIRIPENVNITGEGGVTPLMLAAACGDLRAVKMLIEFEADPYMRDDGGRTALSYAVKAGHEEIVVLFLRLGCNPNLQDNQGCFPLYYAAFFQHMDIVFLLLLDFAFYYCFNKR